MNAFISLYQYIVDSISPNLTIAIVAIVFRYAGEYRDILYLNKITILYIF